MQTLTHDTIENILHKVNKPSRYIGNEPGSANKNWDTTEIRVALAFPDLYEIGISNMGLRILYDKINNYSEKNFLADRVYAPEVDFKEQLIKHSIPLYGVESFKSLKEFDVIAFSLQYELSYPTLLAMLELAGIPYRKADRTAADPLIIAGGPGAYNPAPMADFVDAFIFGDGETVIIDILNNVKSRETLADIPGVYMPRYSRTSKIKKRIEDIDNRVYPVNFPVPFSSSVHDRAVIEIRRGCSRMCRFCQACFVNFPVRERSQENVIQLVGESLKNTGYEEYSLLSLSSNDYSGIEELVRTLNDRHASSGASVSLPSQRADNFSLELAELVQTVRKSTITLAPEAGSQRLRDVINKNLTEEQIIDAVKSVANAGWRNVKLYFMIGLPTETFHDLDAIYDLLKNIKQHALRLTITCSISIFVPKPFTPFQWFGQEKSEVIYEKIRYLKAKTRNLRGVKVNVHDVFLCQLEAVFARGDRKLGSLIEAAYKKGSYLDAWREHFNKQTWLDTAQECDIDLEEYSTREFDLEEALPWDMLDVGIDEVFLKREYKNALNFVPKDDVVLKQIRNISGRNISTNDGVEKRSQPEEATENLKVFSEKGYKYRMKIFKTGYLKFISHLDWQKLIYTAIRKSGLKINYSQGFNPTHKISIGIALPLFIEGKNEYVDIELREEIAENIIKRKLNRELPENSQIKEIVKIPKNIECVEKLVRWAVYRAYPQEISTIEKNNLESIAKEFLLKENIVIEKQTKKGLKKIDIRPLVHSLSFDKESNILEFIISSFRADEFVKILNPEIDWRITRERLLDSDFKELI